MKKKNANTIYYRKLKENLWKKNRNIFEKSYLTSKKKLNKKSFDKWETTFCDIIEDKMNHEKLYVTSKTIQNFSNPKISEGKSTPTLSIFTNYVMKDNREFQNFHKDKKYKHSWMKFIEFIDYKLDIKKKKELERDSMLAETIINNDKITIEKDVDFVGENGISNKYDEKVEIIPKEHNQFFDPLLYIYTKLKKNLLFVYLFILFFVWIVLIIWAIITNVWQNIDYPLSKSYTTWIGYPLLLLVILTIIKLYDSLSKLLDIAAKFEENSIRIQKIFFNKNPKLIFLVVAILFSSALHISYLFDDMQGWCESSVGKFSALGYYNIIVFAFLLWIFFMFIYYIIMIKSIFISDNPFYSSLSMTLKYISDINNFYKVMNIILGVYSLIFFITIIALKNAQMFHTLFIWQYLELMFLFAFVLFAFVIYWKYLFYKFCDFLINLKKKSKEYNLNNNELRIISNLSVDPNHIELKKSKYYSVILFFIVGLNVIFYSFGLFKYLNM